MDHLDGNFTESNCANSAEKQIGGSLADWSYEETDNPLSADDRNFYKIEKWNKDGTKVDRMLYAGNNSTRREYFREKRSSIGAVDRPDHPPAERNVRAVARVSTEQRRFRLIEPSKTSTDTEGKDPLSLSANQGRGNSTAFWLTARRRDSS